MKTSQIFLKELTRPKIDKPKFWDYFSNDEKLRFDLFQQYLSTKLKPDLQLYLDRHLPDDDSNARDQPIKKLSGEFYDLMGTKKMPPEYYSHTIEDTEIYKSLDSVFTGIEDFKKRVLKPKDFDSKEYAEFFAANIINHLENISIPAVTENVLKDFMQDQENLFIVLWVWAKKDGYEDAEYNYRELKRYADKYITDYFDTIGPEPKPEPKNKKPEAVKPDEFKKPKKTLNDYFMPDVDINVVEKIQNDFKDYNGKRMAYLIYLLDKNFNKINYSLKGTNDSRKHFVEALINNSLKMQGINKFFEPYSHQLKFPDYQKDNDYTDIEEKLTKTIK